MNYYSCYSKTKAIEREEKSNPITMGINTIVVLVTIILYSSAPTEYFLPMSFALWTGVLLGRYFSKNK